MKMEEFDETGQSIMLRAMIFDMDGVLVDSEIAWHEIEYERYSELIPGWTLECHRDLTGLALRDSHRLFREKYGLDMTWKDYHAFYEGAAREVYLDRCDMIPGSMDMLEELHDRGVPMGLASSSPHSWIDMVLGRFSIRELFECAVSADDTGGKGKPCPDVYLEAVGRMGKATVVSDRGGIREPGTSALRARDCAALEDSCNGLMAARQAGLFSMGFRNGDNHRADLSGAAMEIDGFDRENRDNILNLFR